MTDYIDSNGVVFIKNSSALSSVAHDGLLPSLLYDPSFSIIKKGSNKRSVKVHSGRSEYVKVEIRNEGALYNDLVKTNRMHIEIFGDIDSYKIDSAEESGAERFNWEYGKGIVVINLSNISLNEGQLYQAEVTMYNDSHTEGVVVCDRDKFVIESV